MLLALFSFGFLALVFFAFRSALIEIQNSTSYGINSNKLIQKQEELNTTVTLNSDGEEDEDGNQEEEEEEEEQEDDIRSNSCSDNDQEQELTNNEEKDETINKNEPVDFIESADQNMTAIENPVEEITKETQEELVNPENVQVETHEQQ